MTISQAVPPITINGNELYIIKDNKEVGKAKLSWLSPGNNIARVQIVSGEIYDSLRLIDFFKPTRYPKPVAVRYTILTGTYVGCFNGPETHVTESDIEAITVLLKGTIAVSEDVAQALYPKIFTEVK